MQAFIVSGLPFFQWLIKTSLQGSLLIGLIFLVKLLLRDRLSVRWYSYLWLLLLLRLALPWVPNSRISVFNLVPEQAWPARTELASSTGSTTAEFLTPQTGTHGPTVSPQPETAPVAGDVSVALSDEGASAQSVSERLVGTLPWVWLIGVLGLGACICIRNVVHWRAIKRERPVTDQTILDLLEDSKMQMRVQTIVGVIVTDSVRSPALFGFVRPRLLLPRGLVETLSLEELQHVFLHELAHLKRRDIYLGWLVSLLQVIHWFNPLVWFALCRLRSDQELACDRLVLSTMTAGEPAKYGQTIVKLFEQFSQINYLPSMAGIMEDTSQLERRIRMIANPNRKSRTQSVVAMLLLVALTCVALTDAHPAHASVDSLDLKVPAGLQRNVLLYLSFDRDGGTRAVDISGMDFHGALHGCEYTDEGRVGGAMRFDGEDDHISIPGVKLHAFSFSAWVKTRTESMNNRRLFLLDSGEEYYAVQGTSRGDVELSGADFGDDDPEPIPMREFVVNDWTYVTTTFDGDAFSVYKNGVLTRSGRGLHRGLTGTAYVGGTEKQRGAFWHGAMDEVALFNRALTGNEIKQLHSMAGGVTAPRFTTSSTVDHERQGAAQFEGAWRGLAVDKPEDGSSRDSLALELKVDGAGRLAGIAAGNFVDSAYCRLQNVKLDGKRLSFEVRHRIQGMRMGITLELKDGTLQGEGAPIDLDEDRCDITLQRDSSRRGVPDVSGPKRGGPVLHYSFDDKGSHVNDGSGQGHHATVHGARYEPNGRVGGAMSFDGNDDYISSPNISLREFTFSAWVKTDTGVLNNRRLFMLSDGQRCYALQCNVGSSVGIYVADDVEVNEYDWTLPLGKWIHVTVTHDGNVFKIYRNGRLTETGLIETSGVTGMFCIGGTDRHRGGFWQGMIDELFVFNRALSDVEVARLYGSVAGAGDESLRPRRTDEPITSGEDTSGSRFAGVWSGMAVDKPGDGNSRDSLTLVLKISEQGRLTGTASGDFVKGGLSELKNLKLMLNRKGSAIGISCEIAHRIAGLRMRVTLGLEDGTLKGEALPIDFDEDSCDILLKKGSFR
jgi:beta-lactamase regulating signal transducer with metallopeptidase domain